MNAQRLPAASRRQRDGHHDRGAAAVEMALVMPLLVAMLVGIIDFSRIFNAELQLSQAAREGARLASLQMWSSDLVTENAAKVAARAVLAAPNPAFGMPLTAAGVQVLTPYCPAKPNPDDVAVVQVSYVFQGIFWMNGSTLIQKAVMRCSG